MTEGTDIPKGYKQTKAGVIPVEWSIATLADFGEFLKGKGISKSEVVDAGNPAIRYGEIYTKHNFFIKEFNSFINNESANNSRQIEQGDLLFAGSGESIEDIGKCVAYTRNETAYAGGDIIILRTINQDAKFLGFLLNHTAFRQQTYKLGQGNSVVHIYSSSLKKIKVAIPPLPEQQKIVTILSTWDKSISTTQAIIEELKLRNKGLAQQLLTGKKRLKGFNREWTEYTLGDIAERVTRRNTELNDTVITISAQRGFVLQEDFFNKRVASATLSNYYLIHQGEFAYNKSYSKGYPMGAFKRLNDLEKAVVTTLYVCFRLKPNVNSNFMEQFFERGMMIKGLMKIAQEGGRAHGLLNIGLADFFNLDLIIPSLKEQEAIESVLSKSIDELKLYEQKLTTLKEQKKGLMQKLLTGEIRVNINK